MPRWFGKETGKPAKKPAKPAASKKRAGKAAASARSGRWDPRRTWKGVQALLTVAAVAGVAVAWVAGREALERHAAARADGAVTVDRIELVDAPRWMTEAWRNRVRAVVAERVSDDPFDGRSLSVAAEVLGADALIESVQQVRRVAGGRVVVEATYREPMALVEVGEAYPLVDREARKLPATYRRDELAAVRLPVILGVSTRPPAAAGATWNDAGLDAALALAATIRGEPFEMQVKAIDAGGRRGDAVELFLLTDDGPVRWGLAPGAERTIEPDAELKLQRLRHLWQQAGSIAVPGRLVEVNGPRPQSIELRLLPEDDRPRVLRMQEAE